MKIESITEFEDFELVITPELQAAMDYHKKCKQLCKDIGFEIDELDLGESIHCQIIDFLQDEEKVKKALFLLKNQAFI